MLETQVLKQIGLLLIISIGVLAGTYDLAQFFLKEAEHRKFWLKIWLIVSATIGVFFWFVLLVTGK